MPNTPHPHIVPTSEDQYLDLAERMAVCTRLIRSRLTHIADRHGLSDSQLSVLWTCRLAPPPGLGQSRLADLLAISPAHISGLVEQLRKLELLAGQRDTADRRRQHWQLTSSGVQRLDSLLHDLNDWTVALDEQLGSELPDRLSHLLGELIDALRSSPLDAHRKGAAA